MDPQIDIILGKYVIQLHNLAISLRHIMLKNNSAKGDLKTPMQRWKHTIDSPGGCTKKKLFEIKKFKPDGC